MCGIRTWYTYVYKKVIVSQEIIRERGERNKLKLLQSMHASWALLPEDTSRARWRLRTRMKTYFEQSIIYPFFTVSRPEEVTRYEGGRGGKRERSPRHMVKCDVYPRVTHDRRILHSLVRYNVNSVLIVNVLYLWLYDARHVRNFVHPGTREKVRHCYSTRDCVAPTFTREIHTRYSKHSRKKKNRINRE